MPRQIMGENTMDESPMYPNRLREGELWRRPGFRYGVGTLASNAVCSLAWSLVAWAKIASTLA